MVTEMCQYCQKTIKITSSVSKADIKRPMRHNPQAKTECVCGKQQTNCELLQGGTVIRYKKGLAIRYKKGPSIRYIGPKFRDFF